MEGMIWNANHVLDAALSHRYNGLPKVFFEAAVGIIMISVVEAGFIFSGNIGTGIILRKKPDGSWSPPSACGLTGLGFGFAIGASLKDLIIFVNDESTLETFTAKTGLKVGTQSELTLGPIGRSYQFDAHVSPKNFGPTIAIAFSKGAFMGLSAQGAVIGVRNQANNTFYERDITAKEILYGDNVILPTHKVTLLDEVYDKLNKLAAGHVKGDEEDEAEKAKKEAARKAAEATIEHAKNDPDVIEVDAAAEAAKESK
jgi:lipid-binding SYLF domain-containing protein